jgi:hypothetical protein
MNGWIAVFPPPLALDPFSLAVCLFFASSFSCLSRYGDWSDDGMMIIEKLVPGLIEAFVV